MPEESYVYTACPGWGDHEFCALKTIVKEGKIVRTEPVQYTGAEACEGHICQKGIVACRQPYNPRRLSHPLKRIGERGEGKWQEISWDQALDEIAEKLVQQRDEFGPESLAIWSVTASVPPSQGLGTILGSRFTTVYGATNPISGYGLDNGPFYAAWYDMGDFYKYMTTDPACFDSSNYVIVWGANPIENQQRMAKHIVEAQSRGAKIVDIGLLFDGTAAKADWFIPVKPGSDTELALSMASLIVSWGCYQEGFLREHTVAPLLVDVETGMMARDEEGSYLAIDSAAGAVVPVLPAEEITFESALEGEYVYEGKLCKPAFQLLKEHLSSYTPARQEAITGVSEDDLVKLTREYVDAKAAYLIGALGLRYQNQGQAYRAFYLLGMLTGNLGIPGGGVTSEMLPAGWPLIFNDQEIVHPLGIENSRAKNIRQADFYERIADGTSPVKSLLVVAGNPVHNCPNRGRWIDEVFPKLDLIVDFDIWMTDTGEYADYVLPDCMPFERTELILSASYNHIVLQEPAIPPQGDCRDATFLFSELAERLGIGEYFDKTAEEWCEFRLQTEWPFIKNIDPPLTWERLKKEKMIRAAVPPVPWNPFWGMEFNTPSGRLEFYSERLVEVGVPFASSRPPMEVPYAGQVGKNGHRYQFFSGRQRFFMQSMYTDDPLMVELSGGQPTARLNPVDAKKEGVLDGDTLECFNERGHVVCQVRLDEAIPPGTVQVWFGWRHNQFEEGMYSELLVPLGSRETLDEIADSWWNDVVSKVPQQPPLGGGIDGMAGAWDTIWDCACSVRRVELGREACDE